MQRHPEHAHAHLVALALGSRHRSASNQDTQDRLMTLTETTVPGAFEPWPVTADHIARHVLVAGTPMPRPQLLVTR
jgi:hypothetical protein